MISVLGVNSATQYVELGFKSCNLLSKWDHLGRIADRNDPKLRLVGPVGGLGESWPPPCGYCSPDIGVSDYLSLSFTYILCAKVRSWLHLCTIW